MGRSAVSAASSHTDLPDIDQDDAILVSYSQSNAEKFTHLRPRYQRRASSEEPKTEQILSDDQHVHVIHISDSTQSPQERRESSPSAVSVVSIRKNDSPEPSEPEETTEDILLNVIENSFKDDEKLQPEDFDILKCLVVPEPSIVMLDSSVPPPPPPTEDMKKEQQIAPPSPYANEAENRIISDKEAQKVSLSSSSSESTAAGEELLEAELEEVETPAEPISVQVIIEDDDGKFTLHSTWIFLL